MADKQRLIQYCAVVATLKIGRHIEEAISLRRRRITQILFTDGDSCDDGSK